MAVSSDSLNFSGRRTSYVRFPEQLEELRHEVQIVNCSSCGAPIDLAAGSACGHCKSPVSMLDMKQPEALLAQLREAAQPKPSIRCCRWTF